MLLFVSLEKTWVFKYQTHDLTCWAIEFDIQWGLSSLGAVCGEGLRNMSSHSGAQTRTGALHLGGIHGVLHWNPERTARDRMTSVVDVDIVISGCEGDIFHTAAAIFIILAGYFCF